MFVYNGHSFHVSKGMIRITAIGTWCVDKAQRKTLPLDSFIPMASYSLVANDKKNMSNISLIALIEV